MYSSFVSTSTKKIIVICSIKDIHVVNILYLQPFVSVNEYLGFFFTQGPESESLTVGHVGNKALIFIGHERPGSISIYSVDGNIASPRFESVYWDIPDSNVTWTQAFNQNSIDSIDPEDLK